MKKIVFAITVVIMLVVSVLLLRPSQVESSDINYNKYHEMLRNFSLEERSVNSSYHDEMRDYLVDELELRGLDVELVNSSEDEVIYKDDGTVFEGSVSNVVATLKSNVNSDSSKNIAFVSHYDSVVGSYGAGDAGIAVISFFAGLDQIIDEERVNDITIIITDHEELGLVGANYIADYRPDILDGIDYLYNWESRGTGGNVILFETSNNDFEGVKNYSKVVEQQFAASFATAVYKKMPNGSDFTVFKNEGVNGLNFAMIEDFANYHTSKDHVDNIPEGTFNTYINNVTQLMKNSAFDTFDIASTQSSIYFNYFDSTIVISEYLTLFLIVVSIIGFVFILFNERKSFSKKIAFSFLVIVISFVIANVLALIPVSIFESFSEYKPPQQTEKIRFTLIYNNLYAITMYVMLLISMLSVSLYFGKKNLISRKSMFMATLILTFVLELVVFKILFGGLVIVLVPVLLLEISYLLMLIFKKDIVNIILPIVLIPVLYPVVYYIYIALTVNAFAILINVLVLFTLYFIHLCLNNEKEG